MHDTYKKIIESHAEKAWQEQEEFLARLNTALASVKDTTVQAVLGGSYAKGTYLQGYDIDIFLCCKDNPVPAIITAIHTALVQEFAERETDIKIVHGSRDYFHIIYKKKTIELVPVKKIVDPIQAENMTDCSQLHVAYVQSKLSEEQKQEVRLAKIFFKAQGLYGAESYINGFSGYILELLLVHYKTFDALIDALAHFEEQTILDPAKLYASTQDIKQELDLAKQGSLILIDPTQRQRNAAAALSDDVYAKAVHIARQYLAANEDDKKHMFVQVDLVAQAQQQVQEYGCSYTQISFQTLNESSRDVAYTKAKKACEYIAKRIEKNGFTLLHEYFVAKQNVMIFLTNPQQLSSHTVQKGPLLWSKQENIAQFTAKYKNIFLDGKQLCAIIPRKYTSVEALIDAILQEEYVQSRLARIQRA